MERPRYRRLLRRETRAILDENSRKAILTIDYYTGYAGVSSRFVCFVRRMQRKTIFRIYVYEQIDRTYLISVL